MDVDTIILRYLVPVREISTYLFGIRVVASKTEIDVVTIVQSKRDWLLGCRSIFARLNFIIQRKQWSAAKGSAHAAWTTRGAPLVCRKCGQAHLK